MILLFSLQSAPIILRDPTSLTRQVKSLTAFCGNKLRLDVSYDASGARRTVQVRVNGRARANYAKILLSGIEGFDVTNISFFKCELNNNGFKFFGNLELLSNNSLADSVRIYPDLDVTESTLLLRFRPPIIAR